MDNQHRVGVWKGINADFIILAVNNHSQLMETLEEAAEILEREYRLSGNLTVGSVAVGLREAINSVHNDGISNGRI